MTRIELPHLAQRVIGTGFAVLFCIILVTQNMPASYTKAKTAALDPISRSVGMMQGWGVFAPIPLRLEVETYAVVTFDDGAIESWEPMRGNFWLGSPRYERWRKVSTRLRRDSHNALWEPNAMNIAEDMSTADNPVTRVQLVRRWSTTPLPGDGFDREYGEFIFYDYDVASGVGEMLGDEYADDQADTEPVEEEPAVNVEQVETLVPQNDREGVPLDDEPAPLDVDEDPSPLQREPEGDDASPPLPPELVNNDATTVADEAP